MKKYAVIFCLVVLIGCSSENDVEPIVDFDIVLSSDVVPAELSVVNNTELATSYLWTFEGADVATSTEVSPSGIKYDTPGIFTITLEATNGSVKKTLSKRFQLFLTDEILTFENVQLGSVQSQASFGIAFSSYLNKVIPSTSYSEEIGPSIDILYFGSDEHSVFTFVSPTQGALHELAPIPNALPAVFVYQRSSDSPLYITAEEFDALQDDRAIRDLDVTKASGSLTEGVTGEVDLPFVAVYFFNGKIGLIKVTELIKGAQGKITFDIKRQK